MAAQHAEPTREQLLHALRVSGCTLDLDDALSRPALAVALKNTARALANPRPAQPAPSLADKLRNPPRPGGDFRMRAANDRDEGDA